MPEWCQWDIIHTSVKDKLYGSLEGILLSFTFNFNSSTKNKPFFGIFLFATTENRKGPLSTKRRPKLASMCFMILESSHKMITKYKGKSYYKSLSTTKNFQFSVQIKSSKTKMWSYIKISHFNNISTLTTQQVT